MKREPCPKCEVGRLRRRTSRMLIEGEREEVWRDCSKQCGYVEKLIMRPAVVIERENSFVNVCTVQNKTPRKRFTNKAKRAWVHALG